MAKRKKFKLAKEVKKLARERVGIVQPSRPLEDKTAKRRPKHKKPIETEEDV